MTNDIIIRRLTIIKYLFKTAIEQLNKPESVSYISVLLVHDSIDMFMNLAAEKIGIPQGKPMVSYFDSISTLTLKPSVNKINKRRNNLKHNGLIPAKIEIEDSCIIAKLFFEENSQIIFGVEFNDVTLLELIEDFKVKAFLKSAEKFILENEIDLSAREIEKAFFHLMLIEKNKTKVDKENLWFSKGYEAQTLYKMDEQKFYIKGIEPFFVGTPNMTAEKKDENGYVEISEGVAAVIKNYNSHFSYIFECLKILTLGLDFKKYNLYRSFMPQIMSYEPEKDIYKIGIRVNVPPNIYIKENIQFAIDFVLEFALKQQEFKY